MNPILDIVADRLIAAGLGVPGETLFIYHSPEQIKRCLLILPSLDGVELDEELPGYKKMPFQVIVRDMDYQSGLTLAKKVVSALNLSRQSVNGVEIKRMRATHDPIAFPIPDSDVIEVSVNMWTAFVEP